MVEFVQLTTECCWGQPSDPCQRGCLTSHACVMWGPRTLNADDDDIDKPTYHINLVDNLRYMDSSGMTFHGDVQLDVTNFSNTEIKFYIQLR